MDGLEKKRILSDARWEAVPIPAPLPQAGASESIERPWTSVRVPGHWQLEDAFYGYEGYVLYRARFDGPTRG